MLQRYRTPTTILRCTAPAGRLPYTTRQVNTTVSLFPAPRTNKRHRHFPPTDTHDSQSTINYSCSCCTQKNGRSKHTGVVRFVHPSCCTDIARSWCIFATPPHHTPNEATSGTPPSCTCYSYSRKFENNSGFGLQ